MKLIIKQYLASLKERDELDAILPDLLSQLGFTVFSLPSRGTRQYGVDVAAVGKESEDSEEKVYLFSIKSGDLTRTFWDGDTQQSLRPSLNDIIDTYIPTHLPPEHKHKKIIICLCFGGDIKEEIRLTVTQYIERNTTENISFEEWNGDKLAELILSSFLREDLLPKDARSYLRKSLALLEEPTTSYKYFSRLIKQLTKVDIEKIKEVTTRLRQINICLWILFSWARDANNVESAYLASEFALLHAWELTRHFYSKKTKQATFIKDTFDSILNIYLQITHEYANKIIPHTSKLHGISVAVQALSHIDVNLKLFDILGRLAILGIFNFLPNESKGIEIKDAIVKLILNNRVLFSPIKEEQTIDIAIAVLFFKICNDVENIKTWVSEITINAIFSYMRHGLYPCTFTSYAELIEHPLQKDIDYQKKATKASILFPMLALWAALWKDENLYKEIQQFKKEHLQHCTFQFWYPDETSEKYFYLNSDIHGTALCNPCIEETMDLFVKQVSDECQKLPFFEKLFDIEYLLTLIACRHYRLPIPLHFFVSFKSE